ncbi:aminoglycoside phosphotransferase family protein [Nocardioides panacisoli]|uniref:Aminoglycoside phosphotransferase domain-containing protein n=1 Tax=Nocardioides panacisoli TaxID=627624 RepID=A0ABP7IQL4_9ACTN
MTDLATFVENPDLVVFRAASSGDVLRVRREVEGRQWAARHGIPTAEIVAMDRDCRWLVSRRVHDEPEETTAYAVAALDVAQRIQALPHPRFVTPAATWRAPRRTVPLRATRLVRAGLDLRMFLAVRRAYDQLPRDATVHHDYHRHNVLNTAGPGVTVIDWEHAGTGPRHHDMVRLVVTLHEPAVAEAAWQMLVASVRPHERPALATQLRWLTLRTYASEIAVARHALDQAQGEHRRARWHLAREWAAELAPDGAAR